MLLFRDVSFNEAVALCGSGTWLLKYSRQHPLVAAAAADVCSDPQRQHLQKVPWKQVLPEHSAVPTTVSEPSGAPASPGKGTVPSSSRRKGGSSRGGGSSSTGRGKGSGSGREGGAALKVIAAAEMKEAATEKIALAAGVLAGARAQTEGEGAALWWEVPDDMCDLCGGGCDADQVQLCEVCSTAQYCSSRCHKAAVAAGKHPWAACRALAAVKAGRLGAC